MIWPYTSRVTGPVGPPIRLGRRAAREQAVRPRCRAAWRCDFGASCGLTATTGMSLHRYGRRAAAAPYARRKMTAARAPPPHFLPGARETRDARKPFVVEPLDLAHPHRDDGNSTSRRRPSSWVHTDHLDGFGRSRVGPDWMHSFPRMARWGRDVRRIPTPRDTSAGVNPLSVPDGRRSSQKVLFAPDSRPTRCVRLSFVRGLPASKRGGLCTAPLQENRCP